MQPSLLSPTACHKQSPVAGPQIWGGFASPPQIDLALKTPYYRDGQFSSAHFKQLTYAEATHPLELFRS